MKLPVFTPIGWALRIGAGLLAIILVVVVLGRLGVSWDPFGWAAARHEQDRQGSIAGQHQTKASDGAAKASGEFADRKADRATTAQETKDAVLATENARDDAGAAGRVGLERMCASHPELAADPACLRLRQARPSPGARQN